MDMIKEVMYMIKNSSLKGGVCLLLLCFQLVAWAQPAGDSYPRFLTTADQREALLQTIAQEEWAGKLLEQLQRRTDGYVARVEQQSDWLTSRLAMYWKSKATQVYVRGEAFERVGEESAPEPTVRYTGTRGTYATHGRPKLEEVVPYDDDENSYVTFCNKSIEGQPMEKVHPSKTGRNIESLNNEIVGIARDAAFLYWLTQREAYARLAAGVFDTYMAGIYYCNVPIDLNHGHQQTLVGMSSFEVIHEDILNQLVPLYDFLHDYLAEHYAQRMPLYAAAFKKWAENIIDNGVPHNNWNLMQARFVMNIALILDEDKAYPDGKGRSYYIDYVVNRSSIRQWSLKQLAAYGYDEQTGIWAECPGYSGVVLNDYANFTWLFDHNLRRDLTAELPVIPKAVMATMQYLFPNRMICGFGDTHPSYLKTAPVVRMIQHAQLHGKREMEETFTALLKCLDPKAGAEQQAAKPRVAVTSFFEDKPLQLKPEVKAGAIESYVSPLFHADNVSWLVQRNGMDAQHSLMASLNGSRGNHMHANGISLELYGKGYVLGPDAGIGLYLYSGLDYAEYYSQFPSHNTVCVDGISAYPVMKSNHAFHLASSFPEAQSPCGTFYPLTYSILHFLEPESHADQQRTTALVSVGDRSGYYVDIFRSRKREGGDKMHDYFYHNLGQQMTLTAADGRDLGLQPTQELAFAGAHLGAYSYLYDKQMAATDQDVRATFTIRMKEGDDITMALWMKGEQERQLFQALSPMTEGYSRIPGMPYNIKEQPTLTFVARQRGEAWQRPFVALYEPYTVSEPSVIRSVSYPEAELKGEGSGVAIQVELTNGCRDLILSTDKGQLCRTRQVEAAAAYTLLRSEGESPVMLLMGDGTSFEGQGITLTTQKQVKEQLRGEVLLEKRTDGRYCRATVGGKVTIEGVKYTIRANQDMERLSK